MNQKINELTNNSLNLNSVYVNLSWHLKCLFSCYYNTIFNREKRQREGAQQRLFFPFFQTSEDQKMKQNKDIISILQAS